MAVAAIPAIAQQVTPENVEATIAETERLIAEAHSLKVQLSHEFALTKDEEFRGWKSVAVIGYAFFQNVVKPQLIGLIDYQIAIGTAINQYLGYAELGVQEVQYFGQEGLFVLGELGYWGTHPLEAGKPAPGLTPPVPPTYRPSNLIDVEALKRLRAQLVAFGDISHLLKAPSQRGKSKPVPEPKGSGTPETPPGGTGGLQPPPPFPGTGWTMGNPNPSPIPKPTPFPKGPIGIW